MLYLMSKPQRKKRFKIFLPLVFQEKSPRALSSNIFLLQSNLISQHRNPHPQPTRQIYALSTQLQSFVQLLIDIPESLQPQHPRLLGDHLYSFYVSIPTLALDLGLNLLEIENGEFESGYTGYLGTDLNGVVERDGVFEESTRSVEVFGSAVNNT